MSKYSKLEDVLDKYSDFYEGDIPSVEFKTVLGEPVIFSAIHNEDIEAVKFLLLHGANFQSLGEYGNTPLHEAINVGHFDIARYLLSKGANPNIKNQEGKYPKDCCWEGELLGIFGEKNA